MTELIVDMVDDYVADGGEIVPLLKTLIDEHWDRLTGDDIEKLRNFLSY